MAYVFLFHDVSSSSGFTENSADKFKISKKKFNQIIKCSRKWKNKIELSFDDAGCSLDKIFFKSLIKQGYKCILFVPTQFIDKEYFLTGQEIKEIHNLGVQIGSHSHSHSFKILQPNKKEFIEDWQKSKDILSNLLNTKIKLCSIPFGLYDDEYIHKLNIIGFKHIYTSDPYLRKQKSNICRISLDNRLTYIEIMLYCIFGPILFKLRNSIYQFKKSILTKF